MKIIVEDELEAITVARNITVIMNALPMASLDTIKEQGLAYWLCQVRDHIVIENSEEAKDAQ
jgi:hypothetical protein